MKLDHITFVAKTLEQADNYARDTFGVSLPLGGAHPLMGTHNLLARIAPDVFLEFIAIDPNASHPDRGRWFALDRLEKEEKLAAGPRLYGWVASVPQVATKVANFPDMETLEVYRGDLRWDFCLRKDREAEAGGVFPSFIDWHGGNSPVSRIPDISVSMRRLQLFHPEMNSIFTRLQTLGWAADEPSNQMVLFKDGDVPKIILEVQTEKGVVKIEGGQL